MRIVLVGRADLPRRVKIARRVCALWDGEVVAESDLAKHLGVPGGPLEQLEGDVVVTVGGDGTILHALRHSDLPVLAVNEGRVGFLTELEVSHLDEGLKRLRDGDHSIEVRHRLKARLGGTDLGPFLNEVAVKTPRASKILTFKVNIDGHEVDNLRADGVIVATATGSTGYALSAGGPLIEPSLPVTMLVPLAPFRLNTRAIVIPAGAEVQVVQTDEKETVLSLDGRPEAQVPAGTPLTITAHDVPARFIRFSDHFPRRMRELLRSP